MATHSTYKMLASMDSSKPNGAEMTCSVEQESSELFDVPQLKPTADSKLTPKPKPTPELGQTITNILGLSSSNQYSPMDKK